MSVAIYNKLVRDTIQRIQDMRGGLVMAGDHIAYAVRQDNMADLRLGKIAEIIPESERPFIYQGEAKGVVIVPGKIRVELEDGTIAHLDVKPSRFVKVGE